MFRWSISHAPLSATIVATSVAAAVSPAIAADMTAAEIKTYAIGVTQYVELGAASVTGQTGRGVIYRAEDGTAVNKTPSGAIWTGLQPLRKGWRHGLGARCGHG